MLSAFLYVGLSAVYGEPTIADPDANVGTTSQVQTEADEAARFARAEAGRWELFAEGADRAKLEMRPDPILRWSNPAVGRIYGSVFVWASGERPAAVASIYRWYAPFTQRIAEFVALSPEPISAERAQKKLWTPAAGQVRFQTLPGGTAPDESSKRRRAQMRSMAREFVPELTDSRVVAEGTRQQLRLLDKPLYQYGTGAGGLLDGGLFAFVVGTDPEVLLLIEAREAKAGREWHYALARMNRDAVRVRYQDQEVWRAPFLENPLADGTAAYHLVDVGEAPAK